MNCRLENRRIKSILLSTIIVSIILVSIFIQLPFSVKIRTGTQSKQAAVLDPSHNFRKSGCIDFGLDRIRVGENTFRIEEDMLVEKDQLLAFPQGSRLVLSPRVNITVRGSMELFGIRDHEAEIVASERGGKWGSILIENTGSLVMKDVIISGAERAIISNSRAPRLENVTIYDSTSGIFFLGDSIPIASNLTIHNVTNGLGFRGLSEDGSGIITGNILSESNRDNIQENYRSHFDLDGSDISTGIGQSRVHLVVSSMSNDLEGISFIMEVNNQTHSVTISGNTFREGQFNSEIRIEMPDILIDGENYLAIKPENFSPSKNNISIFIEIVPSSRGYFHNVDITDVIGWGIHLEHSSPIFFGLGLSDVKQQVIMKESSHLVAYRSEFDGQGSDEGISSEFNGNSIRLKDCCFSDYDIPVLETVNSSVVMDNCILEKIDTPDSGNIILDMNPGIISDLEVFHDLRPTVIYNVSFSNSSGNSIEISSGGFGIYDSIFRDCESGLYLGNAAGGKVKGSVFRRITNFGIYAYGAVSDGIYIENNLFDGLKGYCLVVKGTSVSSTHNSFIKCGAGFFRGSHDDFTAFLNGPITSLNLLELPWAVFIEEGSVSSKGDVFSDNLANVIVGHDGRCSINGGNIRGSDSIGFSILEGSMLNIFGSDLDISEGEEFIRHSDGKLVSDISIPPGRIRIIEEPLENADSCMVSKVDAFLMLLSISVFLVLLFLLCFRFRKPR